VGACVSNLRFVGVDAYELLRRPTNVHETILSEGVVV